MINVEMYRGHIRNHKALVKELGIEEDLPRKKREREILKKGFEKWEYDLPLHLYGMFAFAIYDDEEDDLLLVRDHFGTKPLYYYVPNGYEIVYGTYIKDILEHPKYVKEFDESLLGTYLSLTYVGGENTLFKDIKKLMPGHMLSFKKGRLDIYNYFRPDFRPDNSKSLDVWADEIHDTFKTIMDEIKDDKEDATSFLSGGVDSSYVLAMSDCKECASCGYDDEKFDESHLAAETAKLLGVKHEVSKITPKQFFDEVPYVMKNMELPIGDASAIAFSIACKEVAKNYDLCYSGEGADEFFGGYNIYKNAEKYGKDMWRIYAGNTNIMKEEEKERLLKRYYMYPTPYDLVREYYAQNERTEYLSQMCDIDIRLWLEGDIYLNVDKMSSACGLEIRMPLTDLRIFDIARKIPAKYKVTDEQNKIAFRTAASKVLPDDIAFRKKLGFIVPIRKWLANDRYNSPIVMTIFGETSEKFFNKEVIVEIWEEFIGGNSDLWRKIWAIYTFIVWYDIYFAD